MQISLNVNQRNEPQDVKKGLNCKIRLWNYLTIITVFILFIIVLYTCKTYTNLTLKWLEKQDTLIIYMVILILFTIVSFPITVGYMGIVVATGYLFGVINGLILCILTVNVGLIFAHNILRVFGRNALRPLISNETAVTIFKLISGSAGFRIVLCARLTPIPFGLQNTIFAMSNISNKIFHVASFLGLLPGQAVGVYMGSSLRSMQDVLDNHDISVLTYILATVQVLLAIGLLIWLGTRARKELTRAISEAENSKSLYNV